MKRFTLTTISFALALGLAACKTPESTEQLVKPKAVEPQNVPTPEPAAPSVVANTADVANINMMKRGEKGIAPTFALAKPMSIAVPIMNAPPENRETYQHLDRNGIQRVATNPISTFSIDVDTGSYSNMRRMIMNSMQPPADAIRVEELINYFPYDYAYPKANSEGKFAPFGVTTEIAPAPWHPGNYLLKVGIKASDVPKATLPPTNLVFLVDVSGSMDEPDKLPLLKQALKLLTHQLRPQDSVSLVTYASGTRVVLRPGQSPAEVRQAIDDLVAGGGTNGASGIDLAYDMAAAGFKKGGINRIILATDGDFNVGITRFETLKDRVAKQREKGISLSTLGFGQGNYNDQLMEQLADAGDGQYAYIDNINEAQKVLVDQFTSSMAVVAKDVKLQLEFNPAVVKEYRQIGFENRALKTEDFNNDKVDAGEIGAGHTVTALYEITLNDAAGALPELRYGKAKETTPRTSATTDELAFLNIRYKLPSSDKSTLMSTPILKQSMHSSESASQDFRFAASVAALGDYLSNQGKYIGKFSLADIQKLAAGAKGTDSFGYRAEFVRLVQLLQTQNASKQ